MLDFKLVGYDIRQKDFNQISADLFLWDRDDNIFEMIKNNYHIKENFLGLLEISQDDINKILPYLKKYYNSKIIAILLEINISNQLASNYIISNNMNIILDSYEVSYDICDIDGFFSFFDMQSEITKEYFNSLSLEEKMKFTEMANKKVKEHSPFYLVKILLFNINF